MSMGNMKKSSAPSGKAPMKADPKTLGRVIKLLFKFYPVMAPLTVFCILFSAGAAAIPDILIQKVISIIEAYQQSRDWATAFHEVLPTMIFLISMYILSLIAVTLYSQLVAIITQGFLKKMRNEMFCGMQNLPVKYFDQNKHGDIMSHYTNDIDTLRQLVSQSFPSLIRSITILIAVFGIMIYYSIWMTILTLCGVVAITLVAKKIGGGSAKYFIKQQQSLGQVEAFAQEMMNGQKVIKVFCHEEKCNDGFQKINDKLFNDSYKAHAYANVLGPIIMNIGNVFYVLVAVIGGILISLNVKNIGLAGIGTLGISILIPFLNMTKQFSANVNQASQQLNSIIMGLAGASRIFALMDQKPETDEGYVTLVNTKLGENGELLETNDRTRHWAWKHPHKDGTVTYTKLQGDVLIENVTFGYKKEKDILHNISVFAKPGQKVAFVGATGAGKTTITNLINRYYEISNGKIRYDGINIQKIHKSDLRRSLGIVLQDTNLFTGTVLENIRYGYLEATDEECIEAAKLAGADDFITRLPDGYNTMIENNGSNLSQGQRQLIAIARAAVADPPVMILDEATSSIDTRTEAIVQKGMDSLMKGRTVFVIAHRLSTVKNADVIMVLEKGNIIERGNHEDLIAKKGVYYQLYTGAFELE